MSVIIIIIIIIIIIHDLLSPSRRGCHVKPDNALTIIQYTPLSPYTRQLRLGYQQLRPFTLHPNRVMVRHPTLFQVMSLHSAEVRSERTQEPSKNGPVKRNHLPVHQSSPILSIFNAISRSLHRHTSAAQGHHYTSIHLTTVYPVYPLTSASRQVLIHSIHVSKLSQYSFSILTLLRTSSFLTQSIRDTPFNFSNTSSQEPSHSLSQQFSHSMHLHCKTPSS